MRLNYGWGFEITAEDLEFRLRYSYAHNKTINASLCIWQISNQLRTEKKQWWNRHQNQLFRLNLKYNEFVQPKFSRILFGCYNFIKIRRLTANAEFFLADLRRRTKIWRIRRLAAAWGLQTDKRTWSNALQLYVFVVGIDCVYAETGNGLIQKSLPPPLSEVITISVTKLPRSGGTVLITW